MECSIERTAWRRIRLFRWQNFIEAKGAYSHCRQLWNWGSPWGLHVQGDRRKRIGELRVARSVGSTDSLLPVAGDLLRKATVATG